MRKSIITVHGAQSRRKAYIQRGWGWGGGGGWGGVGGRPGSAKGSLKKLLSVPQCHAALGMIPSTLAWVDQSPVKQRVVATPIRVYPPPTTATASHVN